MSLSNGSAATTTKLFEAVGIGEHFEKVLSVEDAPPWETGASSYWWAAKRCDVGLSDTMLVAVHPWDSHGAHHAGLRTAWINRDHRSHPSYFAPAELQVSSVAALARQVI
ncbi:HAD family hydrolase [Microlunatus antarcticus]|uniref:FMN phosphatase YigB (HAD superfamily) n=1 Tax=Microlunatus antarcticus TaxID=53388 RepID=A0A7W5JVE4_9ACTN|nr:hypothetical protein [Microlunatus antarcticus]MBB3326998.1 FMN phosphatase YigB (HAD superfamily) [Microlunatus antarcticus]